MRISNPLLLSLAIGCFSCVARADVSFDDFLSGTGSNELMAAAPGATELRLFTGLTGTEGGTRDVTFTNNASAQDASLFFLDTPNIIDGHPVGAGINNGSQLFNDEWSRAIFLYDANGLGLNLDLTGEDDLVLEWQPDHLANGRNTEISVTLEDGTGTSHTETLTFSTPESNPGFLESSFSLSLFDVAGVNLADVDAATLQVDTDIAGDYTFVEFRAVPEPAGPTLLLSGAILLLLRRGRRETVSA